MKESMLMQNPVLRKEFYKYMLGLRHIVQSEAGPGMRGDYLCAVTVNVTNEAN